MRDALLVSIVLSMAVTMSVRVPRGSAGSIRTIRSVVVMSMPMMMGAVVAKVE